MPPREAGRYRRAVAWVGRGGREGGGLGPEGEARWRTKVWVRVSMEVVKVEDQLTGEVGREREACA